MKQHSKAHPAWWMHWWATSYIVQKQDHQSAAQRVAALTRFSVTRSCSWDGVDFLRRAAGTKIERKRKRHGWDWRSTVADPGIRVPQLWQGKITCKINFIYVSQHKYVSGKFIARLETSMYFVLFVLLFISGTQLPVMSQLYTSLVRENTSKTGALTSFVPFYTHKQTHTHSRLAFFGNDANKGLNWMLKLNSNECFLAGFNTWSFNSSHESVLCTISTHTEACVSTAAKVWVHTTVMTRYPKLQPVMKLRWRRRSVPLCLYRGVVCLPIEASGRVLPASGTSDW